MPSLGGRLNRTGTPLFLESDTDTSDLSCRDRRPAFQQRQTVATTFALLYPPPAAGSGPSLHLNWPSLPPLRDADLNSAESRGEEKSGSHRALSGPGITNNTTPPHPCCKCRTASRASHATTHDRVKAECICRPGCFEPDDNVPRCHAFISSRSPDAERNRHAECGCKFLNAGLLPLSRRGGGQQRKNRSSLASGNLSLILGKREIEGTTDDPHEGH